MKMFTQFIIAAVLGVANAQVFVPFKSCDDDMQTVEDFQTANYMGKWFEHSRSLFIFEMLGKCSTATYSPNEDGTIKVVNTQTLYLIGREQSIEGTARATPEDLQRGKLSVSFENAVSFPGSAPYWIVDTDYTQYAVVYSCTNAWLGRFENAWILTRDAHPSSDIVRQAEQVLRDREITVTMRKTPQDCADNIATTTVATPQPSD